MDDKNIISLKDRAVSYGYLAVGIGAAGASAFVFGAPLSLGIAAAGVAAKYWGSRRALSSLEKSETFNIDFSEEGYRNLGGTTKEFALKAGLKTPPRVYVKNLSEDMRFMYVANMAILPKTKGFPEGMLIVEKDFAEKFSDEELKTIVAHEITHKKDEGWFNKKFAFDYAVGFALHVAEATAVVGAVALGAPIIVGAMTSLGVVAAAQTAAVTLLAAHPSLAALSVVSSIGAKAMAMVAGLGLGATINPSVVASAFAASIGLKTVAKYGGASLSRHKEYIADRGAAILTGNVGAEIDSFNKMNDMIFDEKLDNLDMAEFVRPKSNLEFLRETAKDVKSALLASHPSIPKRIQRLERIKPNSEPK